MKTEIAKNHKITATLSKNTLLKSLTPDNLVNGEVRQIEDILGKNYPSIATIGKAHGHNFIEGLISAWIMWLNKHLNLSKPLQEDSVLLTSQMIIKDFYFLKFQDISLIFNGVLKGQYGELYENLNTPKILKIFQTYTDQRLNIAEEIQHNNHNQFINKLKNS